MKRPALGFLSCIAAVTLFSSPAWGGLECRFRASGLALNFGTLDPSSNVAATMPVVAATTPASLAGDCANGNMTISIADGASSRLLTYGADTIAYTISGLPITLAKPGNVPPGNPDTGWATWFGAGQITGIIQWSAYANAPAGTYLDTVTIVVTP
jgi:spore coat protein U-like protein